MLIYVICGVLFLNFVEISSKRCHRLFFRKDSVKTKIDLMIRINDIEQERYCCQEPKCFWNLADTTCGKLKQRVNN